MKQNEEFQEPFFAKLLEKQQVIPAAGSQDPYPSFTFVVVDGYQTMKYPSDNDEEGTKI